MVKYIGEKNYEHGSKEAVGVLITNLGTPDAPEKKRIKSLFKSIFIRSTRNRITQNFMANFT